MSDSVVNVWQKSVSDAIKRPRSIPLRRYIYTVSCDCCLCSASLEDFFPLSFSTVHYPRSRSAALRLIDHCFSHHIVPCVSTSSANLTCLIDQDPLQGSNFPPLSLSCCCCFGSLSQAAFFRLQRRAVSLHSFNRIKKQFQFACCL